MTVGGFLVGRRGGIAQAKKMFLLMFERRAEANMDRGEILAP